LELDAGADLDRVRFAAVADLGHRRSELGNELGAGCTGLGLIAEEALEDVMLDLPVDQVPGYRRVESRRLALPCESDAAPALRRL
jgi:hypothetical protein